MIAPVIFMAGLHERDLGWPAGGSLAFSRLIEKRFLDLGGSISYGAKVERIMLENVHVGHG